MSAKPADLDWSWVAGILEGEGCFSIFQREGASWKSLAIHCEMTDEWTIKALQVVTKVGTINTRKVMKRKDGRSRKDTYIWSVQNHHDIQYVIGNIYDVLSPRRQEKCLELLSYIEERSNKNVG